MREPTIARNYAEALFQAGERSGDSARHAELLEALAGAIEADERIRVALESPEVPKHVKAGVLRRALTGRASEPFLRFLEAVVKRGRQVILPAISRQYQKLLDLKFHRVHAGITLARAPDPALREDIRRALTTLLAQEVVAHVRVDPGIIGGIVVRVGDRVMDGSVRRRVKQLRRRMLA